MRNKGITMIQIVITIIIMIILLVISIFYGQNVTSEARLATVYNEITEIESAIEEYDLLGDIKVEGNTLTIQDTYKAPLVDKTKYSKELKDAKVGNCYYLDFTTSDDLGDILEMDDIKNDYILDSSSLKIFLVGGIEVSVAENGTSKNIIMYSSDDILNYYNSIFVK